MTHKWHNQFGARTIEPKHCSYKKRVVVKDIKCKKCSTPYGAKGLFANKTFVEGNTILVLKGDALPEPTRTSIQVRDKHIEHPEGGFMNHSCDPNAKILVISGVEEAAVTAIKNISIGDEITFDYETTEEALAEPFKCNCHGKLIAGWNVFPRTYIRE